MFKLLYLVSVFGVLELTSSILQLTPVFDTLGAHAHLLEELLYVHLIQISIINLSSDLSKVQTRLGGVLSLCGLAEQLSEIEALLLDVSLSLIGELLVDLSSDLCPRFPESLAQDVKIIYFPPHDTCLKFSLSFRLWFECLI